ncbi:hypothetical protein [Melghirimyces algeriensis]|uniref:Sporulation lipoprotein YhcN/YlaJ (Spore_YhcN_YlaJ) n=1 Tax=Melghirimyces algeriensis TaxID=910412 RepID=A0A521D927_9BACL|nr:hypothetical protein [Melghirimyces algeriensis]SMO67591.1 hypothetical protein SAMN06264849_105178 [Melghirimyces algeriensis]
MKRLSHFWYVGVLVFLLGLLIAGCAGKQETGSKTDHRPEYLYEKDQHRYLQDEGRFGLRNANPNLSDVGQWSNVKPPQENVERQMKAIALKVDGVRDAKVRILGGHAAIQVIPEARVAQKDYAKLEEQVLRNVTFQIPRYEIRVQVGLSKWNPLRYLPFGG